MSVASVTLGNDLAELARLAAFITAYCEEHGIPSMDLQLAAEECFVNAVKHGSADRVDLSLDLQDNTVALTVEDNGLAFDPLSVPRFDPKTPMDQRRAGGLGIHLIRNLMDELHYQRVSENNRLTMRKYRDTMR
jgi:serine/threonine-protein kinase RsbW